MKRTILSITSALALGCAAVPATAQDTTGEEPTAQELAVLGSLFGDIFGEAEPLTREQEGRLPLAMKVVAQVMPEGTMMRMMDSSLEPMMEGMMGQFGGSGPIALSELTGISALTLAELDEKRIADAIAILDPRAGERETALNRYMFKLVSEILVEIEPSYRAGLARAYAIRFTKPELLEIDAWFATPIGGKYASESILAFQDPQVLAAMNEMMPALMQRMPDMIEEFGNISTKFPPGRTWSELEDGERSRLAELLGVSEDELSASEPMSAGAETEAAFGDT